jgi:hypothetical protein
MAEEDEINSSPPCLFLLEQKAAAALTAHGGASRRDSLGIQIVHIQSLAQTFLNNRLTAKPMRSNFRQCLRGVEFDSDVGVLSVSQSGIAHRCATPENGIHFDSEPWGEGVLFFVELDQLNLFVWGGSGE